MYGNHETIPTLAAAAAVTRQIRLTTAILIAPFRGNGTLLAKQLATIDSISGGRLTVGIAVGGRPDDYESTAIPFHQRGRLPGAARRAARGLGAAGARCSPALQAPSRSKRAARRCRSVAPATPPFDG